MTGLVSLPVELFRQISGLLSDPDKKALGGTCQSFRSLIAAEIFRKLTIDFHYTLRARNQLQTLANPQTTAHSLVGLFTRHLELRICNLELLTEEENGTRRSSEEQAQRMGEIEEFRGNLGPALTALKRCESLKVSTHPRGGGHRIPPWFADTLSIAIASISTLKEIELSYQSGFPPPAIVAANTVLGLQRYTASAGASAANCTPEFTGALLSSIDMAISGKPELRELKVTTGLYGYKSEFVPTLGELFGGPWMSSSPPLHLLLLELDGWSVDKDALAVAVPHLRNLRTLNLGFRILGSVDLIWDTLSEASIFLKSLRAYNASTPALFRYLSSYQGLEEISLSPQAVWDRYSMRDQDPGRLRDVLNMLSNHKTSLKHLDIASDSCGYSLDDAAALRQFLALENLEISVKAGLLPQLMDVVFSLPSLVVLCLSSEIGWWGCGTGAMRAEHSMNFQIGAWIGECVIPTTSTESKIEDVWVTRGKRFRRRGNRFQFGTVEPDGQWREIGEDEMLDRHGWVVKRPPPPPQGGDSGSSRPQIAVYV